ncbi:MAG TPA: hypothetical protein ENJ28_04115 [Gammaproteobacteria bacterium]|nr:hypothetical protein [Gammaproteobacteria bacterium]
MMAIEDRTKQILTEWKINRYRTFVQISAFIIIAIYMLNFFPWSVFTGNFPQKLFSSDQAIWGQFGDYVGGVLNPIMAFAAFYLLTISIHIQQTELSKTTKALEASEKSQIKSALAQADQAKLMWRTTQLTGINTIMQSVITNIELAREEIRYLQEQLKSNDGKIYTLQDEKVNRLEARERIKAIKKIIDNHIERKTTLEMDISFLRSINDSEIEEVTRR